MEDDRKIKTLRIFLRVYGLLSFAIFGPLCLGIVLQSSLLADGGPMNWTIWNGVVCGGQPCYVPPMLFVIYLVWAVFLFMAVDKPGEYSSFLNFTIWANLFHGILMCVQAATDIGLFWTKFFTDIPFVLILAVGIYFLKPSPSAASPAVAHS